MSDENHPDQLMAGKEEPTSLVNGFDMRSIHEHPPSPPRDKTVPNESSLDPAWDTTKVSFTESNQSTGEEIDGEILEIPSSNQEKDEKKEQHPEDAWENCGPAFQTDAQAAAITETNGDIDTNDTSEINDATFSHLSLSIVAQESELEDTKESQIFDIESTNDTENHEKAQSNDDEPLLGGLVSSSELDNEKQVPIPIEKRIEMYNTPLPKDEDDYDEESSDDEEDSEVEVEYVGQNSDDEDNDEGDFVVIPKENHVDDSEQDALISASDVPSLDVATLAATKSDKPSLQSLPMKGNRNTKKAVPLIAPPPEEKFKKWEEGKLRAQKHVAAMKAAKQGKNATVEFSLADNLQFEPEVGFSSEISHKDLLDWFFTVVLDETEFEMDSVEDAWIRVQEDLEKNAGFNLMCQYVADCVNKVTSELGISSADDVVTASALEDNGDSMGDRKRPWLKAMTISDVIWNTISSMVAAANFVNFLSLTSKLSNVPSPFDQNPFIDNLVTNSLSESEKGVDVNVLQTPQQIIFEHPQGKIQNIVLFVYKVSKACDSQIKAHKLGRSPKRSEISEPATPNIRNKSLKKSKRLIVPNGHPSPFEASVWNCPRILAAFLSFLGDPVAISRMKMVNRFCYRLIHENEHTIMQDAVRIGGLSMNVRPAFWMWITLSKCHDDAQSLKNENSRSDAEQKMRERAEMGKNGKWYPIIQRDVARSFGNMPPHKTGAKLRNDSIVRALVTWGQNRIMVRGVRGGGAPVPTPQLGPKDPHRNKKRPPRSSVSSPCSPPWMCSGEDIWDSNEHMRIDTAVSDWSGVSPVPSFTGSQVETVEPPVINRQLSDTGEYLPVDELALGGPLLTNDMKVDLQNKLSFILHSLASTHEGVGYCQGMDYVVAHLLRIVQDTVLWKASKGSLPDIIETAPVGLANHTYRARLSEEVSNSLVVEEVVFKMMDTLFTTYNLRHLYWPELRCLKTFCRVFERLIYLKLPVLADHFEHHDLNVGLFALGWFQTLFLYLPSMPSATVCHMWDIWLVERSFKIFFRVATAILFLSQPTLLNNELEGMMIYLNTFPDATLLKPDILIPCALNIKVTNRMLQDLEAEVTAGL